MNVQDINDKVIPTDFTVKDQLELIFERQHAFAQHYLAIEKANGLLQTDRIPVDLDSRVGQARLKDFFWRITEELTEAVDAWRQHADLHDHIAEELADALHFMVETLILAGITPQMLFHHADHTAPLVTRWPTLCAIVPPAKHLIHGAYTTIHYLGCASNRLKQRPWKSSHFLVDVPAFHDDLCVAMYHLLACFATVHIPPDGVFRIYWCKSEVNKFRMRSNY